jgi:Ni/Co efflux regulator RcnB
MLRELLTMKNLLFAGIAATSMLMISPAEAASDSFSGKTEVSKLTSVGGVFEGRRGRNHDAGPRSGNYGPGMSSRHRWGHRMNGRWFAGFYAPGGWNGYRAPYRGFTLPTYWVQPSYRIVNFPTYGLYAPQSGYGWSRYYDDAVLTDDRGYVQDYRSNIPWDRYEGGYAPGDFDEPDIGPALSADGVYRYDDGVSSGNRYQNQPRPQDVVFRQGTGQDDYPHQQAPAYQSRRGFEQYERCLQNRGIPGAAIGAVVGGAIGNRLAGRGNRLIGTLAGAGFGGLVGKTIEKQAKKCKKYLPRDDYFYYNDGPQGDAPPPQQVYPQQGGYYQNGWYYPAPTVTTITVMPAVTTTTTVTEEVYYETVAVPAKKRAARTWRPKPKPKPRCGC